MTDSPERPGADPAPLRPAVPADGLDPTQEFPPAVDPPAAAGAGVPPDPDTDARPTAPIAAVATDATDGDDPTDTTDADDPTVAAVVDLPEDPASPTGTEPPAVTESPEVARHRRPLPRLLRTVRAVPGRVARSVLTWTRRPAGRLALPAGLTAMLLLASVASGAVLVPAAGPGAATPTTGPSPATPTPPAGEVPGQAPPVPTPGVITPPATNPAERLAGWAEEVSDRTGVPVVPLQAYGYAELVLAERVPDCHLSWTTLAAIGLVESGHGSAGGATVLADGRVLPAVIGPPLDGRDDRMEIRDTDRGDLDGDRVYDRAVGPMQFIPATWRSQATDANGDGIADVHNIYDAALAAGNYLCQGGRDLSEPDDWWAAILSYNNVAAYADQVFSAADEYGRQSLAG